MSITFTPVVKKKFSSDEFGIINIRITENRKSSYYSLNEKIYLKDWNKRLLRVKERHERSSYLNELIEDKLNELKISYNLSDGKPIRTSLNSFLGYLYNELDNLLSIGQNQSYKRLKTLYYHLETFVKEGKGDDLKFSEITPVFIRDFENYFIKKNLHNNTFKTYIRIFRTYWNKSIKFGVNKTLRNPFSLFENIIVKTSKQILTKQELERIILGDIDKSNPLYKTRLFFLFQFFGQGLRVSDLLTLRYSNLNSKTGLIEFIQYKTKKPHKISLNERLIFVLKELIDEPILNKIYSQKYRFIISSGNHKGNYSMNLDDLKSFYIENSKLYNPLQKETYTHLEPLKFRLDEISFKVSSNLLLEIINYSKSHRDDFIIPLLRNKDFEGVGFDENTRLTKYQYNQILSKTTIYNKSLKDLQKSFNIETTLSSHILRHTYTNMMLMNKSDVFILSKSLGHQNISTTQKYIGDFHQDIVSEENTKMIKLFSTT